MVEEATDEVATEGSDSIAMNLYDIDSSDPRSELVDRSEMAPDAVVQIGRVMRALANLRVAEERVSDASRAFMRLNAHGMRALQYLIVAAHRGEVATPSMLAAHLEISAASTTKLLNRLERDGHIVRNMHPDDRRAFAIEVTPETADVAQRTVGQQQARRFDAAARLSADEREIVIRFLADMTERLSLRGVEWAQQG